MYRSHNIYITVKSLAEARFVLCQHSEYSKPPSALVSYDPRGQNLVLGPF